MSEILRVLGQISPAAATDTNLYTVPAGRATVVSSLIISNRGTVESRFSVMIRPAGAVLANQHFIYHNALLAANSTLIVIPGLTLAATDVVTVRAANVNFSFSLFGSEVVV